MAPDQPIEGEQSSHLQQGNVDPITTEWINWHWEGKLRRIRVTLVVEILIAIFTFASAVFFFVQLLMQREATRNELEAFVSISKPELSKGPDSDGNRYIVINYDLKNAGKTTAHNVRLNGTIAIIDNEDIKNISDPHLLPNDTTLNQMVIAAESEIRLPATPKEDIFQRVQEYDATRHRIFFYGVIYYVDIYGENRWTTFCYFYVEGHSLMVAHRRYNEADNRYE